MEIYCKNCKYEYIDGCCFGNEYNKFTGLIKANADREFLNRLGDCAFYKRKWWKLWIK